MKKLFMSAAILMAATSAAAGEWDIEGIAQKLISDFNGNALQAYNRTFVDGNMLHHICPVLPEFTFEEVSELVPYYYGVGYYIERQEGFTVDDWSRADKLADESIFQMRAIKTKAEQAAHCRMLIAVTQGNDVERGGAAKTRASQTVVQPEP